LSPDICMRRRTRSSVTTAPDDGSRVLEKLSLRRFVAFCDSSVSALLDLHVSK